MVLATPINPGNAQGSVLDWTAAQTFRVPKGAGVINRGDILIKDASTTPDTYKVGTAGANIAGPFLMAMETVASATTSISVVTKAVVAIICDTAIELGDSVMLSATTNGRVSKQATIVALERVGICRGFADSANSGAQVAGTAGDLVAVDLSGGNFG